MVAGPLANFLFAVLAYMVLGLMGRTETLPIFHAPAQGSLAEQAGIQSSDRLVSVDQDPIRSFNDLRWQMARRVLGEGQTVMGMTVQGLDGTKRDLSLDFSSLAIAGASDSPDQLLIQAGLLPKSFAVRITGVLPDSPAERAGLSAGWLVLAANDQDVHHPADLQRVVVAANGSPIVLDVVQPDPRDPTQEIAGSARRFSLTPMAAADGQWRMGVGIAAQAETTLIQDGVIQAFINGVERTQQVAVLSLQAMGRMVMGDLSWRQMSGPVGIAGFAGQSAQAGLTAFIGFLALISISIGVINLLPIPMLDGGHLLYYAFEFVRGQPLPLAAQQVGQKLGLFLIVLLTGLALANDMSRVFGF